MEIIIIILLKASFIWCTFLIPDFLLHRYVFSLPSAAPSRYLFSIFLIALSITIGGIGVLSIAALILVTLLSAMWHSYLKYSGEAMGAESILLFIKPDHFRDVVSVGRSEFINFIYDIIVFALCVIAALGALAVAPLPPSTLLGVAPWLVLVAIGYRSALYRRGQRRLDRLTLVWMPGAIGGLRALSGAIHWALTPVATPQGRIHYDFKAAPDSTIVVIMGESISASRMSLFASKLNTTPGLERLSRGDDNYAFVAKTGLSAGVASNSSVVGFLSGSPFPWRTEGSRNMFDTARSQGFRTHYWSAQIRSPLEVLGGTRLVDDVHSFEDTPDKFASRKDWFLVDKLTTATLSDRELFFIYPRCNHVPYNHHSLEPWTRQTPKESSDWLLNNYDRGLRDFDSWATDIIDLFKAKVKGDLFVFISSDHNELFGENGLKGHGTNDQPIGSLVPYILYTNRPDHPVAKTFREVIFADAYSVATLVMRLLGVTPRVEPPLNGEFYIGNVLPHGRAGYMRLQAKPGDFFEVEHFHRSGNRTAVSRLDVSNRESAPVALT